MGTEWLDPLLRALAVIGMGYGAYMGYRRMRDSGTWSGAASARVSALLLLYIAGGMLIALVYALALAWDYLVVFLIAAGVYFAGGLYVFWKLAARIQARFPPNRESLS